MSEKLEHLIGVVIQEASRIKPKNMLLSILCIPNDMYDELEKELDFHRVRGPCFIKIHGTLIWDRDCGQGFNGDLFNDYYPYKDPAGTGWLFLVNYKNDR